MLPSMTPTASATTGAKTSQNWHLCLFDATSGGKAPKADSNRESVWADKCTDSLIALVLSICARSPVMKLPVLSKLLSTSPMMLSSGIMPMK